MNRLQILFSDVDTERVEDIKKITKEENTTDIIRKSVRLYQWFLQMELSGHEIAAIKDGKTKLFKILV